MIKLFTHKHDKTDPVTSRALLFLLFTISTIFAKAGAPTITSFSPASECTGSFYTVTITGTNFTGATAVKFNGLAAASYTVVSSTSITATPAGATTSGAISVTTSGGTGTSGTTFTVNALPTPTITPSGSTSICPGGSVTLTAGGGTSYKWSTSATTAAITASPATTTTYTVTVTNASSCTATASQVVTVSTVTPTITPSGATTFCAGGSVTLTAGGGSSYAWSNAATTAAITVSPATGTTTYTVTVTNASSCTATASQAVIVNANPTAGITPSGATTFCSGGSVTLTASGGGTYSWSTGASTAAITANSTGTYIVTVTNASSCTATASQGVTVNTVPSATTVSGGGSVCNSATLTATGGTGGTIYWENTTSNGTSTATPSASQTVTASGTYYFRANNTCGWGTQGSATVTLGSSPAVSPITGTTSVCAGSTTTLSDATLLGTWSSSNTAVATVNALGVVTGVSAGTATISYSVTNILYACPGIATATVTVNALPTPSVNSVSICAGNSATLTATGGVSYVWSTGATTASISPSPATTTTYTVTATNASGCTATASGTVTVNANPTAAITPSGATTFCIPASVTLTASGGVAYSWSTGASTAAITASSSNTYTVTVTNANSCTATASKVVTANTPPTPAITPSGPTTFCAGGSVVLTASGGVGYSWSNGKSTAADTVTASGTYIVTVSNAAGCTATTSQGVTVNALPTPTVNNATSCFGASVTLTATGGVSYKWNTGATTTTISTSAVGTYTVTATNAAGCTATASGTVSASSPSPTVNNPATCAGGIDTMHVSGMGAGATYIWSTGAITDTITTTTAGVYTVTATNSSGCSATAQGIATVNALPTPAVANDTVCSGSIATLTVTGSGGVLFVWSTGATTTSITTVTAGTYTVTATSIGGCTATASGKVVLSANPSVSTTNGVICSGTATTLTVTSAGSSFVWSTGATTSSISVTTAKTYYVSATNSYGCSTMDSAIATAASYPTPSVNNPSICVGNTATLTATGGVSYVWSTGATSPSISVSPASTTTYSVTATNAGGCSATASGTVTVNALPSASATSASICSGSPATITASGGTGYHWNTGATTASISVSLAGTYTVTVTNAAGCTATASSTVTIATAPSVTVNSPSVCNGTSATLTATVSAGGPCTYVWSTGATTASISVAPAATSSYTVTATNTSGCSTSASGTVTVYTVPTVTAGSNSPVLLDSIIKLTSTVGSGTSPYTYSWSGPSSYTSTSANPNITTALPANGGTYTVTVSDAHSCTAKSSTSVILNFTSPGGVPGNDALWLNANVGVTTSGSNVTKWSDQSGLANNATVVNGTAPTLVNNSLNNYPVVNFGGSGGLQGTFNTSITSNSTSAFIVTKTATSNATYTGLFSIANTTGNNTDYNSNSTACMFLTGGSTEMATDRNGFLGNYTNANALGNYHMFSSLFSSSANTNYFYTEGANSTNATASSANFGSGMYTIGSRWASGTPSLYLTGQIAEVILFNTQVTAAQRNQVESYLATKYGFTLNQSTATNYVASNGTIFWNATSNGIYKNNIFGVGIDNISTLNQTQSVSINTSQLSINSATGLTYYSFLMVSDNGGTDTLEHQTGLPNSINAALSTVWRASQTGTRTSANYVLNTSSVKYGYYAPIASSMTPYMLIDSNADGIYETYVAATSTSGSNVTFNANLRDGALFTFGFKASIDYGDAWGVPTLTANNGAGHMIVSGVYLGSLIDAELDGQPSVNELGDDTIGLADEDGVNFNVGVATTDNIVVMGTNTITVTASCAGYLNAWADLNQNNSYEMDDEYLIQNVALVAGVNTVTFSVSDSVLYGPTSMRFRFAQHSTDVTGPTGLATNGEVEDYKIYVTAPLVGACTNGFQNHSFESGPDMGANTYIITSETNMPYWRTTATDGMIEQWGSGYNGGGVSVPAYDGTYFMELEANLYGALYQDVYTTPGTKLSWSFAHRGRFGNDTCLLKIGTPENPVTQGEFIDGEYAWGLHSGYYTVPAGQYITRLAFDAVGSYGGNQSEGNFLDDVSVASTFDYGDAPDTYGTYFASNGPYHNITSYLYLGYGVTCDADGKPAASALLDSLDDGVTFPAPCASCTSYTVNINAYNNSGSPATIAGWIDFNKNGVFDNSERASVTIPSSTSEQAVTLSFNVTTFSATSTTTYARFRIANDSTQIATPYGLATSGEVEDYKVSCVAMPIPVPTSTNPACARGPLSLTATGTAPYWSWSGPNGFTCSSQDTTLAVVPSSDSGLFRVYAIYANGCVTDSAVYVTIQNCYVNFSGHIFDDANGDGIIDGSDATTDLGQTIYAVLSDNTNKVLQTSLINSTGAFTFTSVPAYLTGLTIVPNTSAPTVGTTSPGPQWPSNWTGTKGNYGTNNGAGSGVDATPNLLALSTGVNDVTNALLGFDQLPTSVTKNYFISYPHLGAIENLVPANGMGWLAGSDPEDGTLTAGSTFTITSVAGMNGNQLYYDAGGGALQPYEQITGYTTITNFDPTKLYVKFEGAGSLSAQFSYSGTDQASKSNAAPATYTIQWVGTLPVGLMYFDADKLNGDQSLLTWATASEQDNAYFDIERSADAETWETICQRQGAGTTQSQTNYSMIDSAPLPGINYYRLKQVDVDGNFKYSNMAQVTFEGISEAGAGAPSSTLSVYPNPLNQANKLNIGLKNTTTDNIEEVIITNAMGQEVFRNSLPDIQNYQVIGLNLASGVYIVSVHTQSNSTLSSRLVITK